VEGALCPPDASVAAADAEAVSEADAEALDAASAARARRGDECTRADAGEPERLRDRLRLLLPLLPLLSLMAGW